MLKKLTLTLLTLCSSLALVGCTTTLGKAPPPKDRLVCKEFPQKPSLAPLKSFITSDGTVVYLKEEVDSRDRYIGTYIVDFGEVAYECKSQLQWNEDYWKPND